MDVWEINDIDPSGSVARYVEFQRSKDLSSGVYTIPKGARDPQRPHGEDEIYYVVRGKGKLEIEGKLREVREGSVVFVPAGAHHRFMDVTADLVLLVVFGPAEHSRP